MENFCKECGEKLLRIPIPAEKAKYQVCGWGDCMTVRLGTRYNKETGLRQFGIRVMCPNSRWYNDCTNYINPNSLHDSDLPELMDL